MVESVPTPRFPRHSERKRGEKYTLTRGSHITASLGEQSRKNQRQLLSAAKPPNHVPSPQPGPAVCWPGQGAEPTAAVQGARPCPPSSGRAPRAKRGPTTRAGAGAAAEPCAASAVRAPSAARSQPALGSSHAPALTAQPEQNQTQPATAMQRGGGIFISAPSRKHNGPSPPSPVCRSAAVS